MNKQAVLASPSHESRRPGRRATSKAVTTGLGIALAGLLAGSAPTTVAHQKTDGYVHVIEPRPGLDPNAPGCNIYSAGFWKYRDTPLFEIGVMESGNSGSELKSLTYQWGDRTPDTVVTYQPGDVHGLPIDHPFEPGSDQEYHVNIVGTMALGGRLLLDPHGKPKQFSCGTIDVKPGNIASTGSDQSGSK